MSINVRVKDIQNELAINEDCTNCFIWEFIEYTNTDTTEWISINQYYINQDPLYKREMHSAH